MFLCAQPEGEEVGSRDGEAPCWQVVLTMKHLGFLGYILLRMLHVSWLTDERCSDIVKLGGTCSRREKNEIIVIAQMSRYRECVL